MLELASVSVNGTTYADISAAANAIHRDLEKQAEEGMQRVSRTMQRALSDLYREMEQQHGNPWPQGGGPWGTDPDRLSVRSGRGLRTIRDSILVTPGADEVSGQISTGSMTVHETGAVIRARNARYLTIPFRAALDSRGMPLRQRARDWDNTFIARSRRGNLIIFRKETGGTITPLYLLKSSVEIPRRLGLGDAFERMIPRFQARAIADIEEALDA
jgi:hypothetical protein